MFKDGDLSAATFLLETAVTKAPEPITPLANLIEVHCAANRPEMALNTLAQLSRHTPKSENALLAIRGCMIALLSGDEKSGQ